MLRRWRAGDRRQLHREMIDLSLEVTIAVILGIREPARARVVRDALRPLFDCLGPFLLFLPALRIDLGPLTPWGRFVIARRRFRALMAQEIAARRARQDDRADDVLGLLLTARDEAGRPLEDDELQAHLLTLLVLGHESTASALAWGLVALYRDASILTRLRAELESLPADASCETVVASPLLGAVCDEILRHRTIVPEARRRVLRQPWRVREFTIPAGTYLAPCIYLLHRHPALYPDPEAFRPDRFLERRFAGHELMPFGGGIRRCTGASFARFEMALVLAEVVAAVDLHVDDDAIAVRRANLAVIPSTGARVTVTGLAREIA
jgi:cytochrome P450